MTMMGNTLSFDLIVMGTSLGGFAALKAVLSPIPRDFSVPILVVRHQAADTDDFVIEALNKESQLTVKFAEDGERPMPAWVYLAPPDRHLLVNNDHRLKLSHGGMVNFSRPAIDLLFQSAARVYKTKVLAVMLTGANKDGAVGVMEVKANGGKVMIQDPTTAVADAMPKAALAAVEVDYVIPLSQVGPQLWTLTR